MIAMVPHEVPVAKLTAADTRNVTAGTRKGESEPDTLLTTKSAV